MGVFQKNKDYRVTIEDVTATGEGVGRVDGEVLFVPETVPGDTVVAKAIKINKHFAYGRLMQVTVPSPDRAEPLCPMYHRCGGCSMQHIAYPAQLKLKQKQVRDAISRIGGFTDVTVADPCGMENPYHYRNKTQIPIGTDKKGHVAVGFYAKHSHDIVPVQDCLLAVPQTGDIIKALVRYMRTAGVKPYDEATHKGLLRHLFLRSNKEGATVAVLVINGTALPEEELLIESLRRACSGICGIVLNHNTKKTNTVLGEKNTVIFGSEQLTDTLGDLQFSLSPHSFYQVNRTQAEKLYEKGKELLALTGRERVFDLYSGIGSIGLFMADAAKEIIGVEIVPDAVKNAETNCTVNRIENARFYTGAAEDVVPKLYEEGLRADAVILDPPRKGADNRLLDTVLAMAPEKILYISCNPATLARDLKVLTEGGRYGFDTVYPFDLFPHTTHVECVVLLTRVE